MSAGRALPGILLMLFAALAVHRLAWLAGMTGGVIGWDARIYFAAARTAFVGGNPYTTGEIGTRFLNHPALLLAVRPFAAFESAGTWIWIMLLAAAWVGTLRIIARQGAGWTAACLLLPLTAAVEGIFMGQASLLAGLFLAGAYALDRRDEEIGAGILVGLAMICKLSLGVFALYLLVNKRRRGLLAAGFVLAAASAAAEWLVLPGINRLFVAAMVDLAGEIHIGAQNASLLITPWVRPAGAAVLAALVYFSWRDHRIKPLFGNLAAWTLLFSPLTWHHHGVFLALPIAEQIQRREWLGFSLAALIQFDLLAQLAGFPLHTLSLAAALIMLIRWIPARPDQSGES